MARRPRRDRGLAVATRRALPRFADVRGRNTLNWIVAGLAIVWLAPNTQQIMERFDPALDYRPEARAAMPWLRWQPTTRWALATMLLAYFGLLYMSSGFSEFIYFQF